MTVCSLNAYCESCWNRNKAIYLTGTTVKRCPFCGNSRIKPIPVEVHIDYHEREAEGDVYHGWWHRNEVRALKRGPVRKQGT